MKWKTKTIDYFNWYKVFLWFPLAFDDGNTYWLKTVEKRVTKEEHIGGDNWEITHEYRFIENE